MEKPSTIHSTFVLERSFAASPEKVFKAFSDPETKKRWNYTGEHHQLLEYTLKFGVGEGEKAAMVMGDNAGPVAGKTLTLDARYQDIVPNKRVVWAYRMSMDGTPFSAALATVELIKTDQGTDLILTHQGAYFENADGPEMRKGGWNDLLDRLGKVLSSEA
jgi:uncharacterized protein YndB with AHSA1/START domain